ncbi:tyrosine--tRNA ligase [Olsenella uli MSTE5]|nr:tyrosine--tRNA ligase [Olsenella uli MSTE5]
MASRHLRRFFLEGYAVLSVEEQLKVITSGTMQIVPMDELRHKLEKGVPLNIKLGVDPTSPDLHLGHAVPLRKMRQFQDFGHKVTLIIGNGTALIGDPSGRDSTRPPLTEEQVEANAQTYVEQAMKVLDPQKTAIVHNGDWLKPLDLAKMLELMSRFNVARILEREDFHNRYAGGLSISLHEFIYPVLQAYDSVVVKADLEMGGNDQIFNLLAGRDLMRSMGMEPQVALTVPLLVGLDGHKKMSKSYKNYVGLTDGSNDMYGKLMSIADEIVPMYFRLCSTLSVDEIDAIDAAYADGSADPYRLKRQLARNIVDLYHGDGAGDAAEAAFDAQFKQNKVPDDIAEFPLSVAAVNDEGKVYLAKLLSDVKIAQSAGEARRLIDGGGVKVDGVAMERKVYNVDPALFSVGTVIQSGKKRWARLV